MNANAHPHPRAAAPNPAAATRPLWWGCGLLALLLALAALRPLSVPDEGRYAEISRWMLVSGDWLVPRLDGLPFFHKPPLTHWLQAASMAVLGVTPWAARLPGVLLALLLVGGLYGAARRLADPPLAGRAALMLGTSAAVLIGGPYVNHDMGVAAWIASAIWCFALALAAGERPHAGWARAGFVASALGVLTKGLIGLALPALVLLLWVGWTRQWRKVWRLPWASGLALWVVITVPWFVLAGRRHPGLWDYLFGVQQFARYTGGGFNNPQPGWFYPVALLLLLFPWAFFAIFEAFAQARRAQTAIKIEPSHWVSLCWIWLSAIVLFFSVPRSKLIGYILPALPPLALLAAAGWQRAAARWRHAGRTFVALAALPLALSVALTLAYPRVEAGKLAGDVARVLACRARAHDRVLVSGGYPLDLPFVAQTRQPLVVVQDWPRLMATEGDTWRRELLEAGQFEPDRAARLLRTPEVLAQAATAPGHWLLSPRQPGADDPPIPAGWQSVFEGRAWRLWRASAPEGPEAAEHEGLPGCHRHGADQRQPG